MLPSSGSMSDLADPLKYMEALRFPDVDLSWNRGLQTHCGIG